VSADPYVPPGAPLEAPPQARPGRDDLIKVALVYGMIGSTLAIPMALLVGVGDFCGGEPVDSYDSEVMWGTAAIASAAVPPALYKLLPRLWHSALGRAALGMGSVLLAVTITLGVFGIYEALDGSAMTSMVNSFYMGVFAGLILSPVGLVPSYLCVPPSR